MSCNESKVVRGRYTEVTIVSCLVNPSLRCYTSRFKSRVHCAHSFRPVTAVTMVFQCLLI